MSEHNAIGWTQPSFTGLTGGCPYCSSPMQQIFHGGACPRVKAIEYHPWGGIKRIEFQDAPQPFTAPAWWKEGPR